MANKQIIITIHGIHDKPFGYDWQDSFKAFVAEQNHDVTVLNFKYGYVMGGMAWIGSIIAGLEKILRFTKSFHLDYVSKFTDFLKSVCENNPGCEISIISHSLGTWITNEALLRLNGQYKFKSIVFVAGVISSNMEKLRYLEWIQTGKIKQVYAWCSHNDFMVQAIAIAPFGHLGYWGFVRAGHQEDMIHAPENPYFEVTNVQTEEDHCGVLKKLKIYGADLLKQLIS